MTNLALFLQHAKDKVNDHIIFNPENFDDPLRNPSEGLSAAKSKSCRRTRDPLFHDLQVDLLHVDLFGELERKLCALEQLRIYAAGHGFGCAGGSVVL